MIKKLHIIKESWWSFALAVLLIVIHFLLLLNLRFTAWPEMFSYPYLRNNGFLLYQDMIHPYPPLLTFILAAIYKVFGYKLIVLELFTWVILLSSSLLVWLLSYRLTRSFQAAAVSLFFYVLLQPFLEGNMLWFDIAIVPLLLAATLALFSYLEKRKIGFLILLGLFLALAVLVKQTVLIILGLTVLFLIIKKVKLREIFYFLLLGIVLGTLLLIRLAQEKSLAWFFDWTLFYPTVYWGKFLGYVQMELSIRQALLLFFLFIPVFILIVKKRQLWKNSVLQLLLLNLLGSLIIVYPRFSFFHFQSALAFLAIISAYFFSNMDRRSVFITIALFPILLFWVSTPVLRTDWQKPPRFFNQSDLDLAQVIKDKTNRDDKVYLLGLNSSLYMLADRLPPKPWTDNFGWYLETPGVQEQIIARWEVSLPKYVFWRTPSRGNWFDLGVYQPRKIVEYFRSRYNLVGEVYPEVTLWQKRN